MAGMQVSGNCSWAHTRTHTTLEIVCADGKPILDYVSNLVVMVIFLILTLYQLGPS